MKSDNIRYFFPKVFNRFKLEQKRFWQYCNVERMSMRGYNTPFSSAKTFKSRLHSMLGVYDAQLLDGIKDTEKTILVTTADQALRHEFDLLGSGPVVINPIDWHVDFKCGKRWAKSFYIKIGGIKGADIKVPWELSRCQHMLWLGEAYILTKEGKYAKEVVDEINWWIEDNPLMFSVNWTCAMDVAFRAINWIFALNMISSYDGFDDIFAERVSKSLWKHGFFIRNNLEKSIPYSNNHYASDLVGLLYLGTLFRETKKGNRWFQLSKKELFKEIRKQVLSSGVHYERSVSYHRMMTEMLSYSLYLLKRTNAPVPNDITELVTKMFHYVATYTKPNGLAPVIADNDDGRFVPFLKRDFRNHSYLLNHCSIENRFAALGHPRLYCPSKIESKLYADAGIALIREGDNYLYINHAGYSKKPKDSDMIIGTTHSHNDLLSFELSLNGKDLFVDAGTYLYTSSEALRNEFRSTAKHNTVVVDDEEQNFLVSPFIVKRNIKKESLKQLDKNIFEGGYSTIEGQMNHIRRFELDDKKLIITDNLKKSGECHVAKLYFHLAEDINPVKKEEEIQLDNDFRIRFDYHPQDITIIDDVLSPSYGVLIKNKTIVVSFCFDNEITIKTLICKYNE